MVGLFLSNDKLNVLRIGIHPFHAFFPGKLRFFELFYQSVDNQKNQGTTVVYNLSVIKGRAMFKEHLSVAASVSEYM